MIVAGFSLRWTRRQFRQVATALFRLLQDPEPHDSVSLLASRFAASMSANTESSTALTANTSVFR